jgi:hypothetical protein
MTGRGERSAGADQSNGGALRGYRVEMLLLLAIVVAAVVFGLRPTSRAKRNAPDSSQPSADTAAAAPRPRAAPRANAAIKIPSKGKSPTRPVFTALPFTSEERDRELKQCMDRAQNAPTWPGGGRGLADLMNTGLVGDSLVFDGRAVNVQSGRKLVWRCALGNWDGRVGGQRFTTLEAIDGVDLAWSKIAAIDDEVLRRCVVQAQALFPDLRIPPFSNEERRSDDFTLSGVALGDDNSVHGEWRCHVRLQKGAIVSLDVQQPPPRQ